MAMQSISRRSLLAAGLLVAMGLASCPAGAAVSVPSVIGHHMVLQRDQPVPVWGWASPGEKVTVDFGDQRKTAKAGNDGRWEVRLDKLAASAAPASLTISGVSTLTFTNILVGEVWLCSGQSNMEKPIGHQPGQKPVPNWEQELATGDQFPNIRLFKAKRVLAAAPQREVEGAWNVCSSNALETTKFSAAAYFFAREVYPHLNVPIGLVQAAWGGTRIEPWTPVEGFELVPAVAELVPKLAADAKLSNTTPTAIYHGMVAPLRPFALRGALWYQGESNCINPPDGALYADKLEALIRGWRKVWEQDDLAFYYVQLAPYNYFSDRDKPRSPSAESLPEIWEAQARCLRLTNTGMAVITDTVDDLKDIHPTNKQDVGRRLAFLALNKTYGRKEIACEGPMFKAMQVEESKAVLTFTGVGSGLRGKNGPSLNWFSVAGTDGQFFPADARIEGETVVVSSPEVAAPVAVRFGWHEQAQPNFFNAEGLPAAPFRTDSPWRKNGGSD